MEIEKNESNNEKECNICGNLLYDEKLPVLKLNCGHEYHQECIEESFKYLQVQRKTKNKICPYCGNVHEYSKEINSFNKIYKSDNILGIGLCNAVFKTGKKAGSFCKAKGYPEYYGFCKKHKNSMKKEIKKYNYMNNYKNIITKSFDDVFLNMKDEEIPESGIGNFIKTIINLSEKYKVVNEEFLKVEEKLKLQEEKLKQEIKKFNEENNKDNDDDNNDNVKTLII